MGERDKQHWIFTSIPEEGHFYSVQLWIGGTGQTPEPEETGCAVEDLYQAFKARLMREVVAQIRHRSISGCESFAENIELVALRSGEREGG